ncbi:16S rRNA (uracil(1498)-N(3))-methyltransferase [Spirulina sp. CCNP1310]|uniref:16S rRNA (uracil(1498)-N(3))-methyltransferase n=1 Tax=Spirulina sp. CCNP1310 TaxID=3110249 RepID=UPI002B1F7B50|nr:16S rRNA (uracil(1498)-N(3))-methyltransferase [Spirulina sp. CCNP1310]MEA5421118.1 16S rRNA (uracil(1498)-N(3))-methyltransferase [Spirulina sp. CCNP1310]
MRPHLYRLTIDPAQCQGETVTLLAPQHHYLYRVVRLREGDRCVLLNGQGQGWIAQLAGEQAQLLESLTLTNELPIPLMLLVALPKGSGFEEIIRAGTELGVSGFVPVISDRTLLKPSPQKLTRWQRIAQEATEQCERAIVPTIAPPQPWAEALTQAQGLKLLATARGNRPALLQSLKGKPDHISLATGPEGGWTSKEVEGAIAAGFQPIHLGPRILRAVTAPIAAAAIIASWQEGGRIEN